MEKIFVGYDCLKCFVSQIDKILNLLDLDAEEKKDLFLKSINFLSNIKDFNHHPPEIARILYNFLYDLLDDNDPFKKIKDSTNEIAKNVLFKLERANKNLTLEDYLKYAVAGNIIDFGISNSKADYNIGEIIEIIENFEFKINDFQLFLDNIKISKKLLYILDNSGEAVFDLAFIKRIKSEFPKLKIVVAARSQNIINDISFADAQEMGFQQYAEVISSGYGGPGICMEMCSEKFIKEFKSAEVVISKGQGNFETLWGEDKNIFFALKIKCLHVANKSGFQLYSNLFVSCLKYEYVLTYKEMEVI
jgi:uncharacterized protein with ATP-grasp and redox domains